MPAAWAAAEESNTGTRFAGAEARNHTAARRTTWTARYAGAGCFHKTERKAGDTNRCGKLTGGASQEMNRENSERRPMSMERTGKINSGLNRSDRRKTTEKKNNTNSDATQVSQLKSKQVLHLAHGDYRHPSFD
jgi:hypothetical protein